MHEEVKDLLVVTKITPSSNKQLERVAFFNEDGLPYSFGSGSGLPDDVYMDEYGNVIFGTDNVLAFQEVDNSSGKISGCWVDPGVTVTWPTDLENITRIRSLKVYGNASVDLGNMVYGEIDGVMVSGGSSSLLSVTSPITSVNLLRSNFLNHEGCYFFTTGGGTITIQDTTVSEAAELDLSATITDAVVNINSSAFTSNFSISISQGIAETIVISSIHCSGSGLLQINDGSITINNCLLGADSSIDISPSGVVEPGVVLESTVVQNGTLNIAVSGALTVNGSRIVGGAELTIDGTTASVLGAHIDGKGTSITTDGNDIDGMKIIQDGLTSTLSGANTATYAGFGVNTLVD